jgi:hypothetical protein
MRQLPVALTSGTRRLSIRGSATRASPRRISSNPFGAPPNRCDVRRRRAWQASAESGVFSDGFQITGSPQTMAMAKFQDHTATGKLNAVITPTTPRGCHVSIMRWPGRSEAIVRP